VKDNDRAFAHLHSDQNLALSVHAIYPAGGSGSLYNGTMSFDESCVNA
jgi:hypothetical protein